MESHIMLDPYANPYIRANALYDEAVDELGMDAPTVEMIGEMIRNQVYAALMSQDALDGYLDELDKRDTFDDELQALHRYGIPADLVEADRVGDYIATYTGVRFWPLDPRPEEINIEDIVQALAKQCRFGGHGRYFYSVAEHSLRVAKALAPHGHETWGLLHDAAEAYLVDLPRPVKRCMPLYGVIENRLLKCIARRFDLPWPMPAIVTEADNLALWEEALFLGFDPAAWSLQPPGLAWERLSISRPMCWEEAAIAFRVKLQGICFTVEKKEN